MRYAVQSFPARRLTTFLGALILTLAGLATFSAKPAYAVDACNTGTWYIHTTGVIKRFLPYDDIEPTGLACTLRKGVTNFGVVALQNLLIKCYGQAIEGDGIFGKETEDALIKVQGWERATRTPGLAVDGVYGWETYSAVQWPWYKLSQGIGGKFSCDYLH